MAVCGAPMKAEVDDEIRKHVDLALNSHNSGSNEEKKVLVEVTKVTKQVVAGMKYVLELVCEGEQSKKRYTCKAVLLSQPWINPESQVLEFTANPE